MSMLRNIDQYLNESVYLSLPLSKEKVHDIGKIKGTKVKIENVRRIYCERG